MKTTVSRAIVAATVTVTLGLTAACGGEDSGDGKKPSEPAKSAGQKETSEPETREKGALSSADLEKAVLAKGDLKGYKVEKLSAADMPSQTVPADPADCQPFADMFMFAGNPQAEARVGRTMTGPDELDATVISFALLAHEQADAEKVMAGLRTASEKCKAYEHADSKYRDVGALTAPKTGDEAVSYKVVGLIEGQKTPMSFTVVRSGSTLAAFYSINLLKPKEFGVPEKVVEAQVAKLEKL
ncbi:Lipoprotein OS=Streptomyces alboniger OX=132473 GN=CP975_21375 PE=4 SV=1 [Streptomyces alboniger]